MSSKFGASFNCHYRSKEEKATNQFYDSLGGVDDGDVTLDVVGDDLDKIEQHLATSDPNYPLTPTREHEWIGGDVDTGGEIVSVMIDKYGNPTAVIFKDPDTPTAI